MRHFCWIIPLVVTALLLGFFSKQLDDIKAKLGLEMLSKREHGPYFRIYILAFCVICFVATFYLSWRMRAGAP